MPDTVHQQIAVTSRAFCKILISFRKPSRLAVCCASRFACPKSHVGAMIENAAGAVAFACSGSISEPINTCFDTIPGAVLAWFVSGRRTAINPAMTKCEDPLRGPALQLSLDLDLDQLMREALLMAWMQSRTDIPDQASKPHGHLHSHGKGLFLSTHSWRADPQCKQQTTERGILVPGKTLQFDWNEDYVAPSDERTRLDVAKIKLTRSYAFGTGPSRSLWRSSRLIRADRNRSQSAS